MFAICIGLYYRARVIEYGLVRLNLLSFRLP